jgi:Flp pilus assembly pilin Flp
MQLLHRFLVEETGQGITEYALMLGLVVFGVWLALTQTPIGQSIRGLFDAVKSELDSCAGGGGSCRAGGG